MRFTNQGKDIARTGGRLTAGMLLLAHPTMEDPRFRRTVILLTAHADGGSLGVILNQPTGRTLGQLNEGSESDALAAIPLYTGGPVDPEQIILTAWKWAELDSSFQLYFGIDGDKAGKLQASDPTYTLRGFFGHAGWSEGQLQAEYDEGAWLISPLSPSIEELGGDALWRLLIGEVSPKMRLLAEEPDDPSIN